MNAETVGVANEFDSYIRDRANQGLKIAPVALSLDGKSDTEVLQIGYGAYLVNTAGCTDCHTWGPTGNVYLAGGRPFALPDGSTLTSRNLTPSANGLQLTEAQFIEALRTGKDFSAPGDVRMLVMPWNNLRWMSSGDLKAMYAYLRAIPASTQANPADAKNAYPTVPYPTEYSDGDVVRDLPDDTDRLNPNYNRGLAVQPLAEVNVSNASQRHQFARGSYLVNAIAGCTDCHTWPNTVGGITSTHINTAAYLTGGRLFTPPPPVQHALHDARAASANLVGATNGFFHEPGQSFENFQNVIDTGTHADESPPRPLAFPMPWPAYANMLPDDLSAMYVYLSNVTVTGTGDKDIPDYARWCGSNADCRSGETCFANPVTHINECVGAACSVDTDCDVCQTCTSGACTAPTATSGCLAHGIF